MERPARFISYSNNFEDVLLHRLFGDRPHGFFVDVGAADPRMENDCKALYDQGWHGVNIEPNPSLHRALLEQRPRDRSLAIALGETSGEGRYFEVRGTGLSTMDPDEAARCAKSGWTVVEHTVPIRTLAEVLEEAAPDRFDLLKIDVEGWEEQVLRGNDWTRFRPEVVLVEATLPERPVRRDTGVRAFLEQQGYCHVWFDGLNDFYVVADLAAAREAFSVPPNVFDNFESYRLRELAEHADTLESHLAAAQRYSDAEHDARMRRDENMAAAERGWQTEREAFEQTIDGWQENVQGLNHLLLGQRNEIERLRRSVLGAEGRCTEYAVRLEETFRERDELIRLRHEIEALRSGTRALRSRCDEAEKELETQTLILRDDARLLSAQLTEAVALQATAMDAETEMRRWFDAVRLSTSWKLTRPLRVAGRLVRRILRPGG